MVAQERARPGVRLTARGAVALIFVVTLACEATGSTVVVGLAFCAACLAGVLFVQPRDLLSLVVSPPLVFFCATFVSAVLGSLGTPSLIQALGLGLVTDLSAAAPWLFAGSALVLAVAWPRGLPANVRELRAQVRGSQVPEAAAPRAAAPPAVKNRARGDGEGGFAPEPEGYFEPRVYGTRRDDESKDDRPA
ncbi:DUF6542 domain-containing protein [Sphaerisporangium fuscum]|uniref:DUF6542 domain-containing protein n=1 Tax=Sphaerisporangium fuscum TaxID=2835868 RepID=UPI001BDDC0F6|nr:DUF6542 domain-containing protein [Sphaerisporangium fuscum]